MASKQVDAALREPPANRGEVLGDIHVVGEVPDRVVEVDGAVEVRAEFIGWTAHFADEDLRAALRKPLCSEGDGALLEVASRDLGPRPLEVLEPEPRSARGVEDPPRSAAQVASHETVDGSPDLLRGLEEGGVERALAVEGLHGSGRLADKFRVEW